MKIGYLMQEGGPDVRQPPFSGPANHVRHVFEELRKLGHQVRLLACYDKEIWKSDNLIDYERVTIRRLEEGPQRRIESVVRGIQWRLSLPYFNWFDSRRFVSACCQELIGYDLLCERMGWMGLGGGLAAQKLQIPLVLETNNGDYVTELKMLGVMPQGLQLWLSLELMRRAIRRAHHIIATGEGHRRKFIEQWKVNPADVTVVENGSEVIYLLAREQLSSFLPIEQSSKEVKLVFAGSFDPWQGIPILLRALRRVLSNGTPVRLLLIGSGNQMDAIEHQIGELGLASHVTLAGALNLDQLALYLAKSDVGLAPYCGWTEFSGLKLFDYKAAGLAIIASGRDGQPTTLKHGQTGWIVPPCDEGTLAQAIQLLVTDIGLRRRLGQAARFEAERCHGWNHTAQRLERIFQSIVSHPNRSP